MSIWSAALGAELAVGCWQGGNPFRDPYPRFLLDYLFAELEHPDTLLTNEIAVGSFEENLALSLLLGLPHNYSERIGTYAAMEPFS
jgi:hypothetical protein